MVMMDGEVKRCKGRSGSVARGVRGNHARASNSTSPIELKRPGEPGGAPGGPGMLACRAPNPGRQGAAVSWKYREDLVIHHIHRSGRGHRSGNISMFQSEHNAFSRSRTSYAHA